MDPFCTTHPSTLYLTYLAESIQLVERYCSELLIHAADVEGLCQGIDEELVTRKSAWELIQVVHLCVFVNAYILQGLGEWVSIPCTYAGGAKDISDLALVDRLSNGKVDLTFGSSLDIFGGKGVKFTDLVKADKEAKEHPV